ncbi:MAG: pro-sigmaK processing inhibitor BofA family protein [Oscillospiraceae bacterium]|nr:pro-sigmaK processing inhibitor BofA family protein [Oscillospiraceae bacterium]
MDMLYTGLLIVGVAVAVWVLIKILAAPVKFIFKWLINGVVGFALLFLANFVGGFFDFSIPVNLVTCLVAGGFGIPGVIFLVVATLFFL